MTEHTGNHDHTPGEDTPTDPRRAAQVALGIVGADGGQPSPQVRDLVERSATGELTPEQVVEQTVRRYRQ